MSFKDFNDEGPGTFGWDFVLGGNTTGLFPEETHYVLDGDLLTQVTFRHTGGNRFEPVYGSSWTVSDISEIHRDSGKDWFTFEQGGCRFRATLNKKYRQNEGCYIVDLMEI